MNSSKIKIIYDNNKKSSINNKNKHFAENLSEIFKNFGNNNFFKNINNFENIETSIHSLIINGKEYKMQDTNNKDFINLLKIQLYYHCLIKIRDVIKYKTKSITKFIKNNMNNINIKDFQDYYNSVINSYELNDFKNIKDNRITDDELIFILKNNKEINIKILTDPDYTDYPNLNIIMKNFLDKKKLKRDFKEWLEKEFKIIKENSSILKITYNNIAKNEETIYAIIYNENNNALFFLSILNEKIDNFYEEKKIKPNDIISIEILLEDELEDIINDYIEFKNIQYEQIKISVKTPAKTSVTSSTSAPVTVPTPAPVSTPAPVTSSTPVSSPHKILQIKNNK